MIWKVFEYISIISIVLWLVSVFLLSIPRYSIRLRRLILSFSMLGIILLGTFIVGLWISINRPPMRTMAETRLWYSFFVGIVSWIIYFKTQSKPMFILGFIMSIVFLIVDIVHPEYQSKSLMPALQSYWFIPHVVIYMISYAVLGAASLSVFKSFYSFRANQDIDNEIMLSMRLVYIGFVLLTWGMILGAFWAKIAWGNYWAWDPKESWALLTWFFYLILIHIHKYSPDRKKLVVSLIALSFIVLIITWMGIKYLPSGMQSVHVYGG